MQKISHIELFENGHRIYASDDAQTDTIHFHGTQTPNGMRYEGEFTEGKRLGLMGEDFVTHFEGATSIVIRSPKR